MANCPKSIVAMAHVKDVRRSISFYERLGLVVTAVHAPEGAEDPVWAHLSTGHAHLMLALASEPVDPAQQAVLFYMYYEDIKATHAAMTADGLPVSEITYPFYCPEGEFRLFDPDGYCLMLTHT